MSGSLKIVVLCGGRFALPAIQQLAVAGYLCGIGIGKGESSMVRVVEQESEDKKLPFKHFRRRKDVDGLGAWLDEIKPDAVFSICFPFIIPEEVLERNNIRFINFHTGPLPAYRGPMPLFEVLRKGEKETALSIHFMTPDLDEGPVIFQESLKIETGETFGSLATRMSQRTALAAHNMAQMLEYASHIPSVPQDEEDSYYYDQPDFSETFIHWKKMTATEAEALVRACNPWNTGADALLMGRHYKIIDAVASEQTHAVPPGTITGFDESGNMCIACKEGQLLVRIFSNDYGIQSAAQLSRRENMIHATFD